MKLPARLLLSTVVLLPSLVFAQSDMIIKQRAKDLRGANDARENAARAPENAAPAPTPAPAKPATPAPAAPTGPVVTQVDATLAEYVKKLVADLDAIKPGATLSDELKNSLSTDFSALAQGSIKPADFALSKLADDLAAALASPEVSLRQTEQLAKGLNSIINSSMLTPNSQENQLAAARNILKQAHVPESALQSVIADLRAIASDIQKKKPKLYQ